MGVGASLLGLLGNKDPREALLQAVAGGGTSTQPAGGAPYAAAPGGAAPTTGAGGATDGGVQASQPADALMSPPDLAKLYQDVLQFDRKAAHFDRGLGLIGSSISQDGNRAATYDAFAGSGAGGNFNQGTQSFSGMVDLVQGINKQNLARQQRAAMMARIPAIAKQYGIDPETAMYLYDTGKLDSLIAEAEKPNSELRDYGNGQVALIDKTEGTVRGVFGDPKPTTKVVPGPNGSQILVDEAQTDPNKVNLGQVSSPDTETSDTREYDRYVTDQKARNLPAVSFQEWRLTKPASTVVNNVMPGREKKSAEKLGEFDAEAIQKYNNAADNAMDMLSSFDVVEAGLNTGVRTGTFGEAENAMRRFAVSTLGMSDEDAQVAGGELVQKVGNRMALLMRNPESGMGMPGSVSDKDIDFLKQSQIGLGTSEAGNRTALEVFRRLERRKLEYAELAERYYDDNDGSLRGFRAHARKWFDSKPLFEDLKKDLKKADPNTEMSPAEREQMLLKKYERK